jgi:hypothetical protein
MASHSRLFLPYAFMATLYDASPATAFPLPYPIPANITFGICGDLPSGVLSSTQQLRT